MIFGGTVQGFAFICLSAGARLSAGSVHGAPLHHPQRLPDLPLPTAYLLVSLGLLFPLPDAVNSAA